MAKVKVSHFAEKKQSGEKLTMITAYDYPTAMFADHAGFDAVLVGDSLGMVCLGYESTIPVTIDMMVHHTQAVRRGLTDPLLISDMPFMSYKVSIEAALSAAARLIQEGGAEAVKIEGGVEMAETVKRLVQAGIPVMGHVGLTPQSINQLGGFRVQGKGEPAILKLIEDAKAIEEAGAFAIVLEAVTSEAADMVTKELTIPTIGIGANKQCGGQVLVISDVLGLNPYARIPKLARQYVDLGNQAVSALKNFVEDVKTGKFPGTENEYGNKK